MIDVKILVCTDGSEHSRAALEVAAQIAEGSKIDEVAILHVYQPLIANIPTGGSREEVQSYKKIEEKHRKEKEQYLLDGLEIFEKANIKARPIFKKGHPAETIIKVASSGEFDLIVMGTRGIGGLKKIFLGSVSSSVVQEAKDCSVVTVIKC